MCISTDSISYYIDRTEAMNIDCLIDNSDLVCQKMDRIKQLEDVLKDIKNADKRFLQLSSRGKRIKQLEDAIIFIQKWVDSKSNNHDKNMAISQMCEKALEGK